MRKFLTLLLVISISLSSQSQNLSYTCARDTVLGCGVNCFDLTVQFPDYKEIGNDYTLKNVSNISTCLPYVPPGAPGPSAQLTIDDRYSAVISLPFPFPFYGTTYNSLIVSTNGFVSFDVSKAGQFCHWDDLGDLPNTSYDRALIMGPYHDLDPEETTSPTQQIKYQTFGTAPNRKWILSFYKVPLFVDFAGTCSGLFENTHQIILHETSGIIEVDIVDKQICTGWNEGKAMVGLQDYTRAKGIMAPNRKMSDPPWGSIGMNEVWRFYPIGGATLYRRVELLDGSGTTIAVGDTTRVDANTFTWTFPNVCPPGNSSATYVVKTTYRHLNDPTQTYYSLDTIRVLKNAMPLTSSVVNTTCGASIGSVTVTATGGTPPLTYTLNPGAVSNTTGIFTGLAAGNYTVTVTDASGTCTNTIAASVTAASSLTATYTSTNASCPGVSNGGIVVTPTSGTGPFTYSANGGPSQPSGTFTNLDPGTYNILFTDALGCNGTVMVIIDPGTPIDADGSSVGASCPGANDGSATATPVTGIAPFTYSLNSGPFQSSGTFTGLGPNTYVITVRDSRGCTVDVSVTVSSGAGLTGSIFQTPASCPGVNDGTVTLNPTSGIAPYTFSIDGGPFQPSNTFSGLAAGLHTVTFRDGNNCTGTRSINVGGGTAPSTTATSANTSCAGAADGVIVINPIAGSTYTINPGAISNTTGTFTGLAAGTYTLSIATSGGCAGTVTPATVTIAPGAALSSTATSAAASCAGVNNGSVTVTPVGTGTTTYTLNPGAVTNTTGIFNGLATGTYTVTFVTAAGCTGTVSPNPVVTANAAPTSTATATATTCPGVNNGAVAVAPVGAGTSYTLNPGAVTNTTGIFTGLATGTYTVTFVTAAGCNGTVPVNPVVTAGAAPTTTASAAATSCPGVSDGTVTVTPVGAGTTYTLNPGAVTNTTGIFTGLAAGTYTVTFVTAAGCNGTVPVNPVVTAGPPVAATATAVNTSCPTVNNGTITVNPLGAGTTYTLNPGAVTNTTGIFTGLAPNTYTITFVTGAGCTGTVSPNPVVSAGPLLTSAFAQTNPVCANINDGVITITPQAGTTAPYTATLTGPGGPYTYAGNAPITFSGLAPGTYNYSYAEAGGCTGTGGPVTLVTNAPIYTPATLTNLSCNNSANGTVTFNPVGGVAPYQFSANGGAVYQAGNTFSGLAAGPHTFRIRDNVGCIKDTTITLTEPTVLTASISGSTPAGCSNNDGSIAATAVGGTAPYSYTISGSTLNTSGATNGVFTGLSNGPYTITATDAKGCSTTATGTVTLTDNMFLTLGPDVTICAESAVTFNPQTNAETNIFTWTGINGTSTGTIANPSVKNAVATPLDTATYVLHAQWGGCERRDTIIVNVLRKPVAHAGSDTAICNLTYAILRGSAGNLSGTVNYAWTPAENVEFPDQAVTRVYPPGNDRTYTYTLTVTDNYGCNFSVTDQVDVRVQPPVPAYAGNDTTAVKGVPHQLSASGGEDYLWSPAAPLNSATAQNPLATLNDDQKFVVRVTDIAGCIGYDTVFVKVYAGPAYYIPNAFTPNGDGLNDVFRPIPAGIARTEYFRVFNRYGETIFETNQYMKGWDGTFKGKKQPVGAYVWVIKGIDRNGKKVELKGTVMLVQ